MPFERHPVQMNGEIRRGKSDGKNTEMNETSNFLFEICYLTQNIYKLKCLCTKTEKMRKCEM